MAKINLNDTTVKPNKKKDAPTQEKMDRMLSLLGTAVKNLKIITDSVDNINKTVDRRNTTTADNAIKASKAETDAKKEENRHAEEMAKIKLEYKKITDSSVNDERKWKLVEDLVQRINSQYDKLNNMDDIASLSEESRKRYENLNKTILELTKEIIQA